MLKVFFVCISMGLVLAACSLMDQNGEADLLHSDEGLFFYAEQDAYAVGDSVTVVFRNEGSGAVYGNLCSGFLGLDKQESDEWVSLSVNLMREGRGFCRAVAHQIQAGEEMRGRAYLPGDLAEGTYRVTADITRGSQRVPLATNALEVTQE